MSNFVKINKSIVLRFENREIELPKEINESIAIFWEKAIRDNPNLYNGPDYTVESVNENDERIEFTVVKSNYAHYLYNERVGIENKNCRCCSPWSGILLVTNDDYFVVGRMDKTTSIPGGLQISGGGVDSKDIKNGIIDIESTIKRELREEVNLNLDIIDYELKFIEYPDEKRNAYGFLAVGRVDMTKDELERYFEEYKKYLIENKLEVEFDKLVFLAKENALEELDKLQNYKRPYLRDLIKTAMAWNDIRIWEIIKLLC